MYIRNGWLHGVGIIHQHSPHYNARPNPDDISLLVLHNISLPAGHFTGDAVQQLFLGKLNPHDHVRFNISQGLEVSAHLFIRRDGEVNQFVSLDDRAWHAGQSSFQGRTDCNDFSIGIELEGTDTWVYTYLQYAKLNQIMALLFQYYPHLSKQRVVGHSDIAPNRKTDPGPSLDWDKLQFKSQ